MRFESRVIAYLLLLRDEYPSTDEEQSVHLEVPYPDVPHDLNRWLPLVKWILAIPHIFVLFVLGFIAIVVVIVAWFAILFTGRYEDRVTFYGEVLGLPLMFRLDRTDSRLTCFDLGGAYLMVEPGGSGASQRAAAGPSRLQLPFSRQDI